MPKWTEIWQPERMKAEDSGQRMKAGRFAIYRAYKRDTPPLFAERQVPVTPIIFRTIKIEKSSPKRT